MVEATLKRNGWAAPSPKQYNAPAVDQYLCDTQTARKQNAQCVKNIHWLTQSRYHVRIWSYGAGESLGSAHAESLSFPVGHKVMTFESGEQEVTLTLAADGWTFKRDADPQEGFRKEKFDSGKLTEITPP